MTKIRYKTKTRRGGPLRPPTKGARRGAPLHYGGIRGNKGFTLIEIIVLIVMAGILLPTIIVPFVTAVKGSGKPEMVNTAMFLAHQKMEEFMKFQYSRSPELDPTTGFVSFSTGVMNYQGEYEIVYVDSNFSTPSPNVGYKRICVRVRDPMNDTYEICSVVTNFP